MSLYTLQTSYPLQKAMLDLLIELLANRLGVFIIGVMFVAGGVYTWQSFRADVRQYDARLAARAEPSRAGSPGRMRSVFRAITTTMAAKLSLVTITSSSMTTASRVGPRSMSIRPSILHETKATAFR